MKSTPKIFLSFVFLFSASLILAQRMGTVVTYGDSVKIYNGFSVTPDGKQLLTSERDLVKVENGRFIYKTWGKNKRPNTTLYHYDLAGYKIRNKQKLTFANDSLDFFPSVDDKGTKIFFNSRRPLPSNDSIDEKIHLWVSERGRTGWSVPSYLASVNVPGYHSAYVHPMPDGTIIFQSNRPGSVTGSDGNPSLDFWTARWTGQEFENPQPMLEFNSPFHEEQITLDGSGRVAIFTRNVGNDMEVLISVKDNNVWRKPRPLYLTDSPGFAEQCPRLSRDGKTLFYAHNTIVMHVALQNLLFADECKALGWLRK